MDMDLKLIYINHVGSNFRDLNIYEFIFSDVVEDVEGDDWDYYPASNGDVTPPPVKFIKMVGVLETEINLDVIRDSDKFSVWDAVDGVVALAYENLEDYPEYPDHRLIFKFGEDLNTVKETLFTRDIILDYNTIEDE
jgi:hypothetical protein